MLTCVIAKLKRTTKPSLEVAPTTSATFVFFQATLRFDIELGLDTARLNQYVIYSGQNYVVQIHTHLHTHTHTPNRLLYCIGPPGPLRPVNA